MKSKYQALLFILFFIPIVGIAQTYRYESYKKQINPTKNVIVMIPDGTSMGVVSAARWYKIYNNLGSSLYLDPYFCGTVKTFSSNAPIGDSAPTTSCYMTGMPQQTGNVAIYPPVDSENDLVAVDPNMAYQPLLTILEAARIKKNKATGLVVTVEFPHATPADCSAHYYDRNNYTAIASQMAYQNLDVMLGGGYDYVSDDMKSHFIQNNIQYIEDDIVSFRKHESGKIWALFSKRELPYDLDRDTSRIPSLEEMTRKALHVLSQNENGFFLMVEGSKIDWAAHANDAVGCITEFIAFDNAVGVAIDFALKDGNTTVIVLPDHGNSGFTIGNYKLKEYDKASVDMLFGAISKYKKTAEGLEKILLNEKSENYKDIIKEYTDIEITDEELIELINSQSYFAENYMEVQGSNNMNEVLTKIMNERTYFGFTSGGHTGEEVFLAAYHPQGNIPLGMNTNMEINYYLSDVLGLDTKLPQLTEQVFAKHTDVFAGYKMQIDKSDPDFPVLIVKNKKKVLEIPAFKSIAYLNKKPFDIGSVTVYIDKDDTFYLPLWLINKIK